MSDLMTSAEIGAENAAWRAYLQSHHAHHATDAFRVGWRAGRDWQRAQAQPATDDEVKAAAERLLDNSYRLGLDDQRTQDIRTVARAVLEAGQEMARLREALSETRRYALVVVGASEAYGETESAHLWREVADIADKALWSDAALATPGGPESGGG